MRSGVTPLKLFMTADAVGGVFQYATDLAGGLAAKGVESALALLGPPMSESQRRTAAAVPNLTVIETGLSLDWLATTEEHVMTAAASIATHSQSYGAHIVHLNSPALAAASYGAPVVAAAHSCVASWWASVRGGELPGDFRWRTNLATRGLESADAVICPTQAFARTIEAIYGCEPIVIPNGRSQPNRCAAEREPVRAAFTAGRLWDEGKNLRVLDAAAAQIDLPVHAAGPLIGPNGARLRVSHVKPLGSLTGVEMRSWLGKRPIFISAARYEPFGLTVLEAAQQGCALVLTDIPTFRELWRDAAQFVPANDPSGFAGAVMRLAADSLLRSQFGAAAQIRAQSYTVEVMADKMLRVYSSLLQCHRRKQTDLA
jgi:glycogen synthase